MINFEPGDVVLIRKLGTLSAADLQAVEEGLARVLGFLVRPATPPP